MGHINDYEKSKQLLKKIPKFYLGEEVKTPDGTGLIVDMVLDWNGLYVRPEVNRVIVWYSGRDAIRIGNKGSWVSREYKLNELRKIE